MTIAPGPSSAERRRNQRQRALLAGKLANSDASLTVDCVIKNISADGALIETGSPQFIPETLQLLHVREGVAWDSRVIWRRGNRIGLALLDRHDLRESTEQSLLALRRIWSHMVRG